MISWYVFRPVCSTRVGVALRATAPLIGSPGLNIALTQPCPTSDPCEPQWYEMVLGSVVNKAGQAPSSDFVDLRESEADGTTRVRASVSARTGPRSSRPNILWIVSHGPKSRSDKAFRLRQGT